MGRKQHIRQFLGNSLWSGLSTVARAGSALLINKLFAVYYGPNGITLLAHFQNLIAMFTALPNAGINVGLIRHLAGKESGSEAYRSFFWAGLWLNALSFLAGVLAFLLFPDFFLERFNGNAQSLSVDLNKGITLGLFALVLLQLFWLSVLLARQALKPYVYLSCLTSGISILLMWWAVGRVDLSTALVLFLAGQAVSGLVAACIVFSRSLLPAFQTKVPAQVWRELMKFLVMAMASLAGTRLVDFVVREMAIQRFSLYDTGVWQSVVKISESYTMVFVSVLGMVYYPRIAALLPQPQALRDYVRSVLLLVVPLLGVALLAIGALRDFFILLLFQEEFLPARGLMDFQLLGDFLKMSAWVLSYVITVQARVKLYVSVELASGLLYVLLVNWLLPSFGLEGLPMAHAIRYGVYLLFFLYWFRSYFYTR